MLIDVGDRVYEDDRPTVDLGPLPPEDDAGADGDGDATQAGGGPAPDGGGGEPEATRSLVTPVPVPASVKRPRLTDPVHHLPTQQLPGKRTGSVTRLSESRTTASPVEAMRLDEIERTQVFLRVALALCIGGAVVALLTGGDVVAQRVVVIGSGLGALGAVWILMIIRDLAAYEQHQVVVPAAMLVAGSFVGRLLLGHGVAGRRDAGLRHLLLQPRLERDGSRSRCTSWSRCSTARSGSASSAGAIVDRGIISMAEVCAPAIRSRSSASSSSSTSSRSITARLSASRSRSTR